MENRRVTDLGEVSGGSDDIPDGRHSISKGDSAPLQRRQLQKRHQQVLRQGHPASAPRAVEGTPGRPACPKHLVLNSSRSPAAGFSAEQRDCYFRDLRKYIASCAKQHNTS